MGHVTYHEGPNLSDDSEIDESFTVASFAMGSTRIRDGALKLMRVSRLFVVGPDRLCYLRGRSGGTALFSSTDDQGFGSPSDKEHSRLLFNFSRRWIYVYAVPLTFSTTPPVFIPLECEIPFEVCTCSNGLI